MSFWSAWCGCWAGGGDGGVVPRGQASRRQTLQARWRCLPASSPIDPPKPQPIIRSGPQTRVIAERDSDRMKWQIGDVTITQFIEIETYGGKEYILPQATPEALRKIDWLCPHFADEAGRIRMSIHSVLGETPTRRIIVDTRMCNDKQKRAQPSLNRRKGPLLARLAAAGCPPH